MSLVYYDSIEVIRQEPREPALPHEGLHAPDGYPPERAEGGFLGFLDGAVEIAGFMYLVRRLLQELPAVRQNEHALAALHAVLGYLRENYRLAAAGGEHEQGALYALLPLFQHGGFRFVLVGSERYRRGSDRSFGGGGLK